MQLPPAEIAGARLARLRDSHLLTWWWIAGLRYEAARAQNWWHAVYPRLMATAALPLFPLLCAMTALQVASSRSRLYLSASREATIAVVAKPGRWVIEGYNSAHPGTTSPTYPGPGRVLWDAVMPAVLDIADRDGIRMQIVAGNDRLVELYRSRIPDLQVVGRTLPRGIKLERTPRERR